MLLHVIRVLAASGAAALNSYNLATVFFSCLYRAEKKSWYVVAGNFFLLFHNFSAWPCLGPA